MLSNTFDLLENSSHITCPNLSLSNSSNQSSNATPCQHFNNLLQNRPTSYIYPFQNSKKSPETTQHTTQPQRRKNLPRRLRVASHEGHQIRAQRQLPSLRQLATLAFPQLWRFIAGGDDTQARKWEDMGTDMGHDAVSGLAKYTFECK